MGTFIRRFARDRSGTTAIEYGLLAAFVVVLLVAGLTAIGGSLQTTFNQVSAALP